MIHYWQSSAALRESIYIPKYYNPELAERADELAESHICKTIGEWQAEGVVSADTGDEIGKAAYGTGDIPFVRTSDIANWEIKSAPKQGVSRTIYDEYAASQDVREGDILFVRDGTYLIGNNCFIQAIDQEILYQSHVLKIRVAKPEVLDPQLLFLALNNPWVQRQIRSMQFTADTIDTIGGRFYDLVLPIPKDPRVREDLIAQCKAALEKRMRGKAFVKHCPNLMEEVLRTGSAEPIERFLAMDADAVVAAMSSRTVSGEFGGFASFWHPSDAIVGGIYLPTYYDVSIAEELDSLADQCDLQQIGALRDRGALEFHTGDEIGKMAYGTGDIPFLRTSDFANWEIYHLPKQGISEDIYKTYAKGQDVQENDILLVRDGTYLVGSSCIVTAQDIKSLYCGGMFKFRVQDATLDPFLLLGLFNSYIVKRQIRARQFTRDVIDTLGNRIEEVVLPIPKSAALRKAISDAVKNVVATRVSARETIAALTVAIAPDLIPVASGPVTNRAMATVSPTPSESGCSTSSASKVSCVL